MRKLHTFHHVWISQSIIQWPHQIGFSSEGGSVPTISHFFYYLHRWVHQLTDLLHSFQVEMTGSSIFDYCHAGDHAEIAEQLGLSLSSGGGASGLASPSSAAGSDEGTGSQGTWCHINLRMKAHHWPLHLRFPFPSAVAATMTLNSTSAYKGYDRAFCIRMKSTLTKRGCHFKSSGYRVSLCLWFIPVSSLCSYATMQEQYELLCDFQFYVFISQLPLFLLFSFIRLSTFLVVVNKASLLLLVYKYATCLRPLTQTNRPAMS